MKKLVLIGAAAAVYMNLDKFNSDTRGMLVLVGLVAFWIVVIPTIVRSALGLHKNTISRAQRTSAGMVDRFVGGPSKAELKRMEKLAKQDARYKAKKQANYYWAQGDVKNATWWEDEAKKS